MQTYELTYIISSHMTVEEADTVKKDFEASLQGMSGVVIKSDRTAPLPLAYQIKKQSSGFFVTTEFQIEEAKVKPLKADLEKNPSVLRHFLIVKKPVKIMKERRTRKPIAISELPVATKSKGPTKKVEMEDINKKLEEILSE